VSLVFRFICNSELRSQLVCFKASSNLANGTTKIKIEQNNNDLTVLWIESWKSPDKKNLSSCKDEILRSVGGIDPSCAVVIEEYALRLVEYAEI